MTPDSAPCSSDLFLLLFEMIGLPRASRVIFSFLFWFHLAFLKKQWECRFNYQLILLMALNFREVIIYFNSAHSRHSSYWFEVLVQFNPIKYLLEAYLRYRSQFYFILINLPSMKSSFNQPFINSLLVHFQIYFQSDQIICDPLPYY